MKLKLWLVLMLSAFSLGRIHAQLIITEVCPSNQTVFTDEFGEQPDWIELYNSGSTVIDLADYFLSDNANQPDKFHLPHYLLNPGNRIIVFASGRNITQLVDHWETAINNNDFFNYTVPSTEPDTNWIYNGFITTGWLNGMGGIGYGDGDDNTTIGMCSSVYYYIDFNVADSSVISKAILSMDYDDAFIAYLNGKEVARNNVGVSGQRTSFNTLASANHEAAMYTGGLPELFTIDNNVLQQQLKSGTNRLAIQVHNVATNSSDLSSNTFLSFGISNNNTYFGPNPVWFNQSTGYIHSNFKISGTGETILLSDLSLAIVDQIVIPQLDIDHSYGRSPDTSTTYCVFNVPSPLYTNNASICYSGYAENVIIEIPAGHYTDTLKTTMYTLGGSAPIYFTTDGDDPDLSDNIYTDTIQIYSTQVLRARVIPTSGNYLPGRIATTTYLINENTSLPVFSLASDSINLWDYNYGIYVFGPNADVNNYPYFGSNFWMNWERPVHIEYFAKDKQNKFSFDGGIKIHGGWSRGNDQKSFRLLSKSKYGPGSMSDPLIPDKPWINDYTNINLRNGGNDYWGARSRDAFMQRLMKNSYVDYMGYEPAVCFLNGMYWGELEIREREDEFFIASNHGISSSNVDILSHTYNGLNPIAGSSQGWFDMMSYVYNGTVTDTSYYNGLRTYLDLENFTDYFVTESYVGNGDFMSGYPNNIKMWKPSDQVGPWRHVLWDIDFGLGLYDGNYNRNYLNEMRTSGIYSGAILDHVLQNPIFKNYFINRYADMMNTVFQSSNLAVVGQAMIDSLSTDLPRHHNRWGGNMGSVIGTYNNMYAYNNYRIPAVRNLIQSDFGMTSQVTVTLNTLPAGAGHIKISTIIPENLPWSGVYFNGNPVRLTAIANPGYTFLYWQANNVMSQNSNESIFINITQSDQFTAVFAGNGDTLNVIISEINYHSEATADAGDWIEIYNGGNTEVNLTGWRIEKQTPYQFFQFPDQTKIPSHGFLLVCSDSLLFRNEFPSLNNCISNPAFDLKNSSDRIALKDAFGVIIQNIIYSDSLPWPFAADGEGRTLERDTSIHNENSPSAWFDGCMFGSPGEFYHPCEEEIVISEINYNPTSPTSDWIELLNPSSQTLDISGWEFKDDDDLHSFIIAPGTLLLPMGRIVISQDSLMFSSIWPQIDSMQGGTGFGLSNSGELLRVYNNNGKLRFSMRYSDALPWPQLPDGGGTTLELLDPSGKMNHAENWFSGCPNGSPSRAYDPNCFVGINEVSDNWNSWYDPQHEQIIISSDEMEPESMVYVYDINGRLIHSSNANGRKSIRIDASTFAKGMYTIKLQAGEKNFKAKKLVVL